MTNINILANSIHKKDRDSEIKFCKSILINAVAGLEFLSYQCCPNSNLSGTVDKLCDEMDSFDNDLNELCDKYNTNLVPMPVEARILSKILVICATKYFENLATIKK